MTAKKLNPKEQNRRQIFWTALIASVIIGLMTWYDLQPNKFLAMQAPKPPQIGFRFIGNSQDAATVPDDGSGLIIWQGYLSLGPDGEAVYEGVDLTPQNFPQRQIDLHIGIADLDSDSDIATLSEHIVRLVKSWEVKSNIVSDLYFDVSRVQMDNAAYERLRLLIKKFRNDTKIIYRVNMVDDVTRLVTMPAEQLEALYADAGALVIPLPPDASVEEVMELLNLAEKLNHPFKVLAPTGKDPISYLADERAKLKHFTVMIVGQPPAPKGAENREP